MLKSVLLSMLLFSVGGATEYEIQFSGSITVKVVEKTPTPVPPPPPPPPPDPPPPDVLPAVIEVGPGKMFAELHQIDPTAIPENAEIRVYYRAEPYRSKLSITKPGVVLRGVPGPNGEKPIISGENAQTHPKCPLRENIQGVSLLCVSGIPEHAAVTISGLEIRDAQETDRYTNSAGVEANYGGGTGMVRITAGTVTLENCKLSEGLNAVFSKSLENRVRLTMRNCEVTNTGDSDGIADEALYLESYISILENCTIHNHKNATTQGVHSRCNKFVATGCRIECQQGICWFGNSCEGDSVMLVNGAMPDGVAEFTDCQFLSQSGTGVTALRTDAGWNIAKQRAKFSTCIMVQKAAGPPANWKGFWCPCFAGGNCRIEFAGCTFAVLAPNESSVPMGMYFGLGRNEIITFTGQNKALLQAPVPSLGGIWGGTTGTTFVPENWQSVIATEGNLPYSDISARVQKLLEPTP